MKHPARVYPAHLCLSCRAVTTNKNYCDIHQNLFKAHTYSVPSPLMPAREECRTPTVHGRKESRNAL